MQKTKPHKAWAMLVGCCCIQGGTLGMVVNCRGIFYTPIIEDLGFSMGAFSFFVLVYGLCSCLLLPFMSRLYRRYDSRLLMGGSSFVFSGTVIVMGFFNTLPAFYIAGAIQGFAAAFLTFYPVQLILNNWFREKIGFAFGMSAAFAGLVGAAGNPLGSAVMEAFGWRAGYWVMGGITFLMLVPVSVFLLRLSPEDCGMLPYGAQTGETVADEAVPLTASEVRRSPYFWLLVVCGLISSELSGYYAHLSPFGTYAGYGATMAALLVSFSMAGNVLSKLILGQIHDRRGLDFSLAVGTLVTLAGFLLLLLHSLPGRIIGSLLYGFSMAMSSVMITIAVKDLFGKKIYGDLIAFTAIAATVGSTIQITIIGYIVDALGAEKGYPVSFVLAAVMTLLLGLLLIIGVRGGRRMVKEHTHSTLSE